MLGCEERIQAPNAIAVMPDVAGTASNGGAAGLGDRISPASTAWHAAQVVRAKARPGAGPGDDAPCTTGMDGGAGAAQAARTAPATRETIQRRMGFS